MMLAERDTPSLASPLIRLAMSNDLEHLNETSSLRFFFCWSVKWSRIEDLGDKGDSLWDFFSFPGSNLFSSTTMASTVDYSFGCF